MRVGSGYAENITASFGAWCFCGRSKKLWFLCDSITLRREGVTRQKHPVSLRNRFWCRNENNPQPTNQSRLELAFLTQLVGKRTYCKVVFFSLHCSVDPLVKRIRLVGAYKVPSKVSRRNFFRLIRLNVGPGMSYRCLVNRVT